MMTLRLTTASAGPRGRTGNAETSESLTSIHGVNHGLDGPRRLGADGLTRSVLQSRLLAAAIW